ncbi:MAG: GTPase HflX [Peptoniphilaceae bacterium]
MEKITELDIERVIVVGTDIGARPYSLDTSIKELEELVKAAGAEVVGVVTQNIDKYSPKFLIGTGKIKEIRDMVPVLEVDIVLFNDELSGVQLRNLEDFFNEGKGFFEKKVKVLDRTNLILDIFAQRATTYEGKLQVELAQLQYQLPRLLGIDGWSRTGGGIGTRGPGEQIIETDRRRLLREIDTIKEKLKKSEKTRTTMRSNRSESDIYTVSLVGYTNAGKSTILNRLKSSDSKDVFVKNMLFATLDPNSRKAKLLNGMDFIISDTVGFVSKLPTKLVEAFKSTLEEIKYSDLIIHVIDASSEDLEIQYSTTMGILKDLEIRDTKILTVFNKMDRVEDDNLMINPEHGENRIYISAKEDEDLNVLLKAIEDNLPDKFKKVELLIDYNNSNILSEILDNHNYENLEYLNEGVKVEVTLNIAEYNKFKEFVIKNV